MGQMYLFECFVCILVELNEVTDPRRVEGYYCPSVLWLKKWQTKAVFTDFMYGTLIPKFSRSATEMAFNDKLRHSHHSSHWSSCRSKTTLV